MSQRRYASDQDQRLRRLREDCRKQQRNEHEENRSRDLNKKKKNKIDVSQTRLALPRHVRSTRASKTHPPHHFIITSAQKVRIKTNNL